jgi:hypothetical protein
MKDAEGLFSALKIDTWYKAIMYLGAIVFVISLFTPVKGLTNSQLELLSGGAFLFGLGRWKNHKVQGWFKPPNAYTGPAGYMSATVRSTDSMGILLEVAGVVLILVAVWKIVRGH